MELVFAVYFLLFFVGNAYYWHRWLDRTEAPTVRSPRVTPSVTRETPVPVG